MKKLIACSFLLVGIYACCEDPLDYWVINDFEVLLADYPRFDQVDNTLTTDTALMYVVMQTDWVASMGYDLIQGLTPALYAFQCPENGELGMKDPVTGIQFTSDSDFNQIPAGQPLDSLVRWSNGYSLQDFLMYAPERNGGNSTDQFVFLIVEKPEQSLHHFKVRMEFESGRVIERMSEQVKWN